MSDIAPEEALGLLPDGLRDELLTAFNSIVENFLHGRWEPSELNGGKLCEVIYTILRGHVDGAFPSRASKPPNMVDACRQLEQATDSPRSVRIQIPRLLIGLYEIRNNRGVGHVGGDVDPNHMDAVMVMESSKWLVAELVRIFHDIDTQTATKVVDALVDRTIPIIWEVDGKRRVLDPNLSQRDQTLLLLYTSTSAEDELDLVKWVEPGDPYSYRRDVLCRLHDEKLIEYDGDSKTAELSPAGAHYVEQNLPLEAAI